MQKKFKLFRFWEGYRSTSTAKTPEVLGFKVKEPLQISRGNTPCKVVAELDMINEQPLCYHIESIRTSKRACKIVDKLGRSIAEVRID